MRLIEEQIKNNPSLSCTTKSQIFNLRTIPASAAQQNLKFSI